MSRFARSTALVTGLTVAGVGLGFWANLLTASRFGVGADMDAYLAATTLPSLISLILTTSLAATFIPVFTAERQKDPGEAWRIAAAFMNIVALAGLAACLIGMLFADTLIRLMTPGLDPSRVILAAEMLRWLLPTVALTAVNQLLSGVFYAEGKFFAPLLIRVSGPLLTVVWILAFAADLHVKSLVFATLSAHGLQTLILFAGLIIPGRGGKERLLFAGLPDWKHPAVRKILRLAFPLMLAMCFYKLGPAFERWLASGIGTGSISILGYATRLTSVIQPVLISGIAISGFTLMSEHAARGDMRELKALMTRSCNVLFFASVPLAVLLCGFAKPLIGIVYERGAFSPQDTLDTSRLFAVYALGLPAGAVGTVVGQAFYAFHDTRIPIIAGILDLALFATLGTLLAPRLGLVALPLAFVFSLYVTTLLITELLSRKTGFSLWPLFLRPFTQSLAAALAALALGLAAQWALQFFLPASRTASGACVILAAVVYLLAQRFLFRSPEAARLFRLPS